MKAPTSENPLQGRAGFAHAIEEPLREAQAVAWLMTEAFNAIVRPAEMSLEEFGRLMAASEAIHRLTGLAVDAIDNASVHSFLDYCHPEPAA